MRHENASKKPMSRSVIAAEKALTQPSPKRSAITLEGYLIPCPQKNASVPANTANPTRVRKREKDSPLLRKMLQQKTTSTSCVSAACSSQDDPMAYFEPLDLKIKKVDRVRLQTENRCDSVNDQVSFPSETSLRYFLKEQRGENAGIWSTPSTGSSAIHPTAQVLIHKPGLGDSTAHSLPRVSEREFAQGLHPTQKKSATTLVKFFHGRTEPPIFSCVLELELLSPHSLTTELSSNEASSSQLNIQKKVVTSFPDSQGKDTVPQHFQETQDFPSHKVVHSLLWTARRPEHSCSTKDRAKIIGTHPYASSKPSRCVATKHLEKSLNVVLREEVTHQENEQLTSSVVNQALPFKKRKWLWRSSLKEELSVAAENKRPMRPTTCLPRHAFFTSNGSVIDFVSSDEDSLASNPLEIDLDRPDTP